MRALSLALAFGFVLLTSRAPLYAQHRDHATTSATAILLPEMGTVHYAVSTSNPEAQRFFNQGLVLIYGFNHDEAVKAFRRATEFDPQLAMAHWGIALALGPNINMPMDSVQGKVASEAIRKAQSLAAHASEHERAYIDALAVRYPDDPATFGMEHATAYANAMKGLMERYPDDLDAATLYAESLMDLKPWKLWTLDGQPAEGTEEIITVLESVLRRDPYHIGANHYYIHAVEASPQPERALASAARLGALAPGAGHLVHMPGHIYMRTGDFESVARVNEEAVLADKAYVQKTGAQGIYPSMYASHNIDFLVTAYSMSGQFEKAREAAEQFDAHVRPMIEQMPMFEYTLTRPASVLVRFNRWDDVLKLTDPGADRPISRAFYHYAHGVAHAAKGDTAKAKQEREAFGVALQAVPADGTFGLNPATDILNIAGAVLDARIAQAKGDVSAAVERLEHAVQLQDAISYNEPTDWYYPVRESLGGLLLQTGRAKEAEAVFRADLRQNPRNARSLYGLAQSLRAQGKEHDASLVEREVEAAWKQADTELSVEAL